MKLATAAALIAWLKPDTVRTAFIFMIVGASALGVVPAQSAAVSQKSVRLDIPSGYFATQPVSPQKKSVPPSSKPSPEDECLANCATFDSGYAWAREHRIARQQGCQGRAKRFVTGCLTFVAEQRRAPFAQNQKHSHRRERTKHRRRRHRHGK